MIAVGPHRGRKVFKLQTLPTCDEEDWSADARAVTGQWRKFRWASPLGWRRQAKIRPNSARCGAQSGPNAGLARLGILLETREWAAYTSHTPAAGFLCECHRFYIIRLMLPELDPECPADDIGTRDGEAGFRLPRDGGATLPRLHFGQFYGRVVEGAEALGISVREVGDLPPGGVPRHAHEHAHFCLVISGRYEVESGDLRGRCRDLTLLFHPAGTVHEDRFLATGGRALMISLEPELIERSGDPSLADRSVALDDPEIGFPASRIRHELRAPDGLSGLSIEGLALELLSRVSRRVEWSDTRRPRWLDRAVALLRESATTPARVTDVAAEVGVHPVHLARVFRRCLGLAPGEYLRRVRIRRAMDLIERSTDPLSTIACRAGFCDQSDFTRAFRREMGTTPGGYRRAVKR